LAIVSPSQIEAAAMPPTWSCPECGRTFNRANTRHSCGIGDRAAMLAGKPAHLVALYEELETIAHSLGDIEIVAKDRYALFRTTRIFADVVFMQDALRLALQLDRVVEHPLFFKTVQDPRGRVQQVARLQDGAELHAIEPYLRQAHRYASG
jgi:predicted transport protein